MRFLVLMCLTMALSAATPNVTLEHVPTSNNFWIVTDVETGARFLVCSKEWNVVPLPKLPPKEPVNVPPKANSQLTPELLPQPTVMEVDTSKMQVQTAETFVYEADRAGQLKSLTDAGWTIARETRFCGFPKYTLTRLVPKN